MTRFLLLLLLTIAAYADQFDSLRRSIQKRLGDQNTPSLAIAAARDGRIIWEEAFGWADRERRIASSPYTMYSLASISKPITATALMILVERGKVDLDRPVNDYLGGAKLQARAGAASEATVRRVANHTSGLPLHYQFFYEDQTYRAPPREETIRRYGNLITPPGERYQYSNLGYGVLDHLIARLAGKPYAEFLRDEVFGPLGLTRSAVGVPNALAAHQALRYGSDGQPLPFYDFDHPGGSAVYASAHDLVRFAMFHLKNRLEDQKRILRNAAIDAMQRPTARIGDEAGYGVGWRIDQSKTGPVVSHSGGMGGVATNLVLLPRQNIAIAVLCNARTALPEQVTRDVIRLLVPGYQPAGGSAPPPAPGEWKPPAQYQGKWTGKVHTYKGEVPLTLEVPASGKIRASLGSLSDALFNGARLQDGYLIGRLMGDLGTEDANRTRYALMLTLKLRGDVLNGGITAQSMPAVRAGNALTYWVDLRRQ